MKKKKISHLMVILVLIVLLSPRLIALSWITWRYYHTNEVCYGEIPTPHTGVKDQVPVAIYKVKTLFVLTDQGYLFPGDEYLVSGDGWVGGAADLLWLGREGATFLVTYSIWDPESGRSLSTSDCKWFAPIED